MHGESHLPGGCHPQTRFGGALTSFMMDLTADERGYRDPSLVWSAAVMLPLCMAQATLSRGVESRSQELKGKTGLKRAGAGCPIPPRLH